MFCFSNALKQIGRSIFFNIFIFLELTLTSCFLVFSLNSYWSMETNKKDLEGQFTAWTSIISERSSSSPQPKTGINYRDYLELKDKFPDSNLGFQCRMTFEYYSEEDGFQTFYLLFTSELEDSKIAYAGSNCINLENQNARFFSQDELSKEEFDIKDGQLLLNGLSIEMEEKKELDHEVFTLFSLHNDISLKDSIVLPLSYLEEVMIYTISFKQLSIEDSNVMRRKDAVAETVTLLADRHGSEDYVYEAYDVLETYDKRSGDIIGESQRLGRFAIFAYVLTCFGSISFYLFLLRKRVKNYAIRLAFGAAAKQLIQELFWELSLVCLTAGGIGVFFGRILTWKQNEITPVVTYQNHWEAVALVMFLVAVIVLVVLLPFCKTVSKLKYTQLTRESM